MEPNQQQCIRSEKFYNSLQTRKSCLFPWKGVWKAKAPPRIAFFTWTATWGRIFTADNLRRRGIILVKWYCLYKKNEETVNHLFSIASTLEICGTWFSSYSDLHGLCLTTSKSYFIVGLKGGDIPRRLSGKLFL